MRTLLGIILGAVLTVAAAYLYDSTHALSVTTGRTTAERPLVNWDIVGTKWDHLSVRLRSEWSKLAG